MPSSDLLECTICLEAFRNPHILPRCGHTFCLCCIDNLRDTKCPICRQVFDRRNVRPNFVLQQLLAEGGSAAHNSTGCSGVARPSQPSAASTEAHPEDIANIAATYGRLGVPPKLAELLAEEDADIALRVYILDNSGSMAAGDGHVLEVGANGRMRNVCATRWEEVKAMALHHADWNAQLGVPCEFILLNSPNPANPQEGVDIVRVDEELGPVEKQKQILANLLNRTRPNHGTPLTERLQHLLFRLRNGVGELEKNGQKVMVTIVTDGAPNGPRQSFVQTLRQLTREIPAVLVIRLCTDENDVTDFYDGIDKEVELPLDIVDDLNGEAKNVYRVNPWLTYTPVLQTVREAGTLSKVLDFVDERPLLPMEVAVMTQLLLRSHASPQYPRNPEDFLCVVEKELANARPVFDGRTFYMTAPINLAPLKAAVLPTKFSAIGQMAHAVGMGELADWWFTGRNPFLARPGEEEGDGDELVVSGHAPLAQPASFSIGQQVEYYSSTKSCWFPCTILQIDPASGAVMVSVKPGHWILPAQQGTCIRLPSASCTAAAPAAGVAVRPAGSLADQFAGAELIEYRSKRYGCWMPCVVIQRDASSGNIMTHLKPGEWLMPQQQTECCRPFDQTAAPVALEVGQQVLYHSRSQLSWFPTVVTNVDPASCSIMVEMRPGLWIDVEQQKYFVRPLVRTGEAENSTGMTNAAATASS